MVLAVWDAFGRGEPESGGASSCKSPEGRRRRETRRSTEELGGSDSVASAASRDAISGEEEEGETAESPVGLDLTGKRRSGRGGRRRRRAAAPSRERKEERGEL